MVRQCVWNLLCNLIGLVEWKEALTSKLDTTLIGDLFYVCSSNSFGGCRVSEGWGGGDTAYLLRDKDVSTYLSPHDSSGKF